MLTQRFGRGWKAHPEVRERLGCPRGRSGDTPEGPEGSGDPPEGLGGVERPTRMFGRHTLRSGKGGRPTRGFGRPTRRFRKGRVAHSEVWEESGWVGSPTRRSKWGR